MASPRVQLPDEVGPTVDACIGGNPHLSVEACGLACGVEVIGGTKQRVSETDRPFHPDLLTVGPSNRQRVGHPPEQPSVDAYAVEMDDSGDATHASLIGRSLETISRHP